MPLLLGPKVASAPIWGYRLVTLYRSLNTCASKAEQSQYEKYFPCLSAQFFCSHTESQKVLLISSCPIGKLPLYLFFSSSVRCSVRILVTTFTLFAMYTFKKPKGQKKHHRLKTRFFSSKTPCAQIWTQNKAAWICLSLAKVLMFNILVINTKCCTLIFLFVSL